MGTLPAESGIMLAPHRVPAVASNAIQTLLREGRVFGTVLGSSSHAAWLLVEGEVVVITTRDTSRLPNGVEISSVSADRILGSVIHGSTVLIDQGEILTGNLLLEVVRWWDPRPVLPSITCSQLVDAIEGLPASVEAIDGAPLFMALVERSTTDLLGAAENLLGLGEGLTPEGDDFLAGVLSAIRILGEALGDREMIEMIEEVAEPLLLLAREQTTTFSASLLNHSIAGNVAAPAGALFRSLAGRGDIATSYSALFEVGHTSGPALAAGIIMGASVLSDNSLSFNGGKR